MSCGIYKITNLINRKSYIGQSVDIEQRWKKHKYANDDFAIHQAFKKYGINNFSFEILEECNQSQLNEREIHWISFYDSIDNGYNMIPGGSNGAGIAKGFQVEQYALSGELINRYNSAKDASRQTSIQHGDICRCCRGEQEYAGLYQWKYVGTDKQISPIDINKISIQREICQYDLNGNFIAKYDSLSDAQNKTGIKKSTICNVCKGKGHTAGGFRWSYNGEPLTIKKHKGCKTVQQFSLEGKLLHEYSSLSEASQETGVSAGLISEVCNKKKKQGKNFIWKYKGE